MSISTYFRPNIHQNGPEILGVKGVALANFKCNGLSCDEFLFHFFVYGCLIPTQGEIQIILLIDVF
jgi:hypothetical protein